LDSMRLKNREPGSTEGRIQLPRPFVINPSNSGSELTWTALYRDPSKVPLRRTQTAAKAQELLANQELTP